MRSPERANQILIESFIEGKDFGCDGFVVNGDVCFLTIRKYDLTPKPNRQVTAFYYPALIEPEVEEMVHNYFKEVITALGLRESAFHSDFKLDINNRPVLIEIGPRLPGFGLPSDFIPYATGICPFDSLIDIALGNDMELKPLGKNPTCMYFFQFRSGKFKSFVNKEELASLPGVVALRSRLEPGALITPFTNGTSAMNNGYIVAIGNTLEEAKKIALYVKRNIKIEYYDQ